MYETSLPSIMSQVMQSITTTSRTIQMMTGHTILSTCGHTTDMLVGGCVCHSLRAMDFASYCLGLLGNVVLMPLRRARLNTAMEATAVAKPTNDGSAAMRHYESAAAAKSSTMEPDEI